MTKSPFELRYTPAGSDPQAVVFEPHDEGWLRTEFAWTDAEWRPVGSEPIDQIILITEDCDRTVLIGGDRSETLTGVQNADKS